MGHGTPISHLHATKNINSLHAGKNFSRGHCANAGATKNINSLHAGKNFSRGYLKIFFLSFLKSNLLNLPGVVKVDLLTK